MLPALYKIFKVYYIAKVRRVYAQHRCVLPALYKIFKVYYVAEVRECMHCADLYYQLCTRYSRCTMWQRLESVCTLQVCTTSFTTNREVLCDCCTIEMCTTSCVQYNRVILYDSCVAQVILPIACRQPCCATWQLYDKNVYYQLSTVQSGCTV